MYGPMFKIIEKLNFKVNQIFSIHVFIKGSNPNYASGTSTVLSSTSPLAPSLSE